MSAAAEAAHAAAFDAALVHAKSCRKCWTPIIRDDEGNPGLYSEACGPGIVLLETLEAAERALLNGKVGIR
jgi:hypothetical protein